MKKKTKKPKDPLRLINWANDGYPPIDLNKSHKDVRELINEIFELRKQPDIKNFFKKLYENYSIHNLREIESTIIRTRHFIDSSLNDLQKQHWEFIEEVIRP